MFYFPSKIFYITYFLKFPPASAIASAISEDPSTAETADSAPASSSEPTFPRNS
jgi:hypothetical protein